MLQANELRIGNLVYDSDRVKPFAATDFMQNEDFYEPIPLTPEWLERMGFDNDCNATFGEYNAEYRWEINVLVLWGSDGCTEGHNIHFPCNHVHQLQNLYFALTGEELTVKELAQL